MTPLQILFPMGGLGQRFRDQGYDLPKPLIAVDGEPMVLRALRSFDGLVGDLKIIFIVRQDAQTDHGLAESLVDYVPGATCVLLAGNTRGAVETCLVAANLIDTDTPLVVMDCDLAFRSREYFSRLSRFGSPDGGDGLLLSFPSQSPRYSYAQIDASGRVVDTAEKVVISQNALAGAYGFRSGRLFREYAERLVTRPLNSEMREYYLSFLFREMVGAGLTVHLAKADEYHSFGTPEELAAYHRHEAGGSP
uniref:SpaE n=1 Tax=Spirochaeta aurantia TaxID=147 RepID=Q0PI03_SPIAU|nr:SpaE [Spirochaeta aurantia]